MKSVAAAHSLHGTLGVNRLCIKDDPDLCELPARINYLNRQLARAMPTFCCALYRLVYRKFVNLSNMQISTKSVMRRKERRKVGHL
mmetsp:Transcript_3644/g.10147  ORF Transcript_3644/g.10147 Transcript_3644/m.10147 type:complete len:86 (+) Transcript_3644:869-1126(+)